jgi:hypothetical protein
MRARGFLLRSGCVVSVALGCALCAACASAPARVQTKAQPAPTVSDVGRFLPLEDATVFAYETSSDLNGQKGLLVLEVRRPHPDRAELVVAGRAKRVEIDSSGIRLVTGGYLLKSPIALGARWQGDFGSVEVTALDKQVRVPAGSFSGCIETQETLSGTEFSKRTITTYCPHVGIVARHTEAESDQGAGTESLALRSVGPRVDLSQ